MATAFYTEVLGLTLLEDTPYAVVFNAGGTMLRMQKAPGDFPRVPHTVLGWKVKDIAETVAALAQKKVRFERYDFMTQDELGIWTTPDGAKVAWFKDPDGNLLSLTEFTG